MDEAAAPAPGAAALERAVMETCGFAERRVALPGAPTFEGLLEQARRLQRAGDLPLLVLGAGLAAVNRSGQIFLSARGPPAARAMKYLSVSRALEPRVRGAFALSAAPCQVVLLADACGNTVGASYAWECSVDALPHAMGAAVTAAPNVPNVRPRVALRLTARAPRTTSAHSRSARRRSRAGRARRRRLYALSAATYALPLALMGDAAQYLDAATPKRVGEVALTMPRLAIPPEGRELAEDLLRLAQVCAPCTWLHAAAALQHDERPADRGAYVRARARLVAEQLAYPYATCTAERARVALEAHQKASGDAGLDPVLSARQSADLVLSIGNQPCSVETLARRIAPALRAVPLPGGPPDPQLDALVEPHGSASEALAFFRARAGPLTDEAAARLRAADASARAALRAAPEASVPWDALGDYLTDRAAGAPRGTPLDAPLLAYCDAVRHRGEATWRAFGSTRRCGCATRPRCAWWRGTTTAWTSCRRTTRSWRRWRRRRCARRCSQSALRRMTRRAPPARRCGWRSRRGGATTGARALCAQAAAAQEIVAAARSVARSLHAVERLREWVCALCPTEALRDELARTLYDCEEWAAIWRPALLEP